MSVATATPDRLAHAGVTAHGEGLVTLTGPALALERDLDRAFLALAARWSAEEEAHPPLIEADVLGRLDYFSSFPHLVTFPMELDPAEANIDAFRAGDPLDEASGTVRLTRLAPARHVLPPAACYHVYAHHEDEQIVAAPRFVTTRNTCFRREAAYQPLRRQWGFSMREVVCLGDRDEVVAFLEEARELVSALCRALELSVGWDTATDPFFRPSTNPRYLMQRIEPVKHEARTDDGLAIASVNLHHDHFGTLFGIRRADRPAVTGCLAFGIERWIYALVDRHGPDPRRWPDVATTAAAVTGGGRVRKARP